MPARLPSGPGVPSLSSEAAVRAVVRQALGSRVRVQLATWYLRRDTYVVAAVTTERPTLRLVVKLEQPGERPNRHLDVMATIAQLVRRRTSVPTFEVVAVDVSRRTWPWEYLIVTGLPGITGSRCGAVPVTLWGTSMAKPGYKRVTSSLRTQDPLRTLVRLTVNETYLGVMRRCRDALQRRSSQAQRARIGGVAPVVAVGAVIEPDGRYLLARYPHALPENRARWTLPRVASTGTGPVAERALWDGL